MSQETIDRARNRVGSMVKDKWRIESLLGAGGMACVYAATHRNGLASDGSGWVIASSSSSCVVSPWRGRLPVKSANIVAPTAHASVRASTSSHRPPCRTSGPRWRRSWIARWRTTGTRRETIGTLQLVAGGVPTFDLRVGGPGTYVANGVVVFLKETP